MNSDIDDNCFKRLKQLKLENPPNVSIAYLNINSFRNKFTNLANLIGKNLDILCIAETKLDDSFPTPQFLIPGFKEPYRLDNTKNSGGLMVYVNTDIPSRQLKGIRVPNDIQIIPIEINLRKMKWLVLPIYRPPKQKETYVIEQLCSLLDNHTKYENIILLGDFNMEASDETMMPLISGHNLHSLVRTPTCFKSVAGCCIDLLLTNRNYNFKYSQTFETGMSGCHLMIYTMLKTTFAKLPPKKIQYRCYKNFVGGDFQRDLFQNINQCIPGDDDALQSTFEKILDKHAPQKLKILRGNHKPHINKELRKAIYTRSRLKNIANKTDSFEDVMKYKFHRNLVNKLNIKTKKEFYKKLKPNDMDT